jgi:putative flippase GtrA
MTPRLAQPAKFVLVGAGGFVLNVAAFTALFRLGVQYAAASVAAYLFANAAMYVGNRRFTFRLANDRFLRDYVRYLAVGLVVATLTGALLVLVVEGTGVDPRVGQALALTAVTPVAFVLVKRWTFRLRAA